MKTTKMATSLTTWGWVLRLAIAVVGLGMLLSMGTAPARVAAFLAPAAWWATRSTRRVWKPLFIAIGAWNFAIVGWAVGTAMQVMEERPDAPADQLSLGYGVVALVFFVLTARWRRAGSAT